MNHQQSEREPNVVVLAGPNGAGKSTSAAHLLQGALGVDEFVNADTIAKGISGFAPDRAAIAAGRVMLDRLKQLAGQRRSFAFETTLASRSFARWLRELKAEGYRTHVVFLWLPSADMAVARVAGRVRTGGHNVPEDVIRRRYTAGLRNFFGLYQPLANSWQMIDNSTLDSLNVIAAGAFADASDVRDRAVWAEILAAQVKGKTYE